MAHCTQTVPNSHTMNWADEAEWQEEDNDACVDHIQKALCWRGKWNNEDPLNWTLFFWYFTHESRIQIFLDSVFFLKYIFNFKLNCYFFHQSGLIDLFCSRCSWTRFIKETWKSRHSDRVQLDFSTNSTISVYCSDFSVTHVCSLEFTDLYKRKISKRHISRATSVTWSNKE